MKKIIKVSGLMVKGLWALIILLPLYHFAIHPVGLNLIGDEYSIETPNGTIHPSEITWTLYNKVVMIASDVIYLIPLLIGLWVLKAIFSSYKKGVIFSVANAKRYRTLGVLLFLQTLIIRPLSNALIGFSGTLNTESSALILKINVDSSNIGILFFALMIVVISWIMLETSKFENRNPEPAV